MADEVEAFKAEANEKIYRHKRDRMISAIAWAVTYAVVCALAYHRERYAEAVFMGIAFGVTSVYAMWRTDQFLQAVEKVNGQ